MTSYTCVFSSVKPAHLTKIFMSLLASRLNDSIILSVLISHRAGLEIIKLSGGLGMSLASFSFSNFISYKGLPCQNPRQ